MNAGTIRRSMSVSDQEEEEEGKTRRPRNKTASKKREEDPSPSPSPRRRGKRSELDKLLEAGSSSFHFETAKEAKRRSGGNDDDSSEESEEHSEEEEENGRKSLGPIHVDVSEGSSDDNGKVSFVYWPRQGILRCIKKPNTRA